MREHGQLACLLGGCQEATGETEMTDTIIKRLRRKVEIVRLDAKAKQDAVYHDMNEMLSLLDMLEREMQRND
jgi:hypothetical protein